MRNFSTKPQNHKLLRLQYRLKTLWNPTFPTVQCVLMFNLRVLYMLALSLWAHQPFSSFTAPKIGRNQPSHRGRRLCYPSWRGIESMTQADSLARYVGTKPIDMEGLLRLCVGWLFCSAEWRSIWQGYVRTHSATLQPRSIQLSLKLLYVLFLHRFEGDGAVCGLKEITASRFLCCMCAVLVYTIYDRSNVLDAFISAHRVLIPYKPPKRLRSCCCWTQSDLIMEMEEIPLTAQSRQNSLESQRERQPLPDTLKRLLGKSSANPQLSGPVDDAIEAGVRQYSRNPQRFLNDLGHMSRRLKARLDEIFDIFIGLPHTVAEFSHTIGARQWLGCILFGNWLLLK